MLDINQFKSINDEYGHTEGDHALRLVAECLRRTCNRRGFFISRYGGDEFIVVCELTEEQPIQDVCESIHAELGRVEIPCSLTVSIGYAQYTQQVKTQQDLIARADEELYKAKRKCLAR